MLVFLMDNSIVLVLSNPRSSALLASACKKVTWNYIVLLNIAGNCVGVVPWTSALSVRIIFIRCVPGLGGTSWRSIWTEPIWRPLCCTALQFSNSEMSSIYFHSFWWSEGTIAYCLLSLKLVAWLSFRTVVEIAFVHRNTHFLISDIWTFECQLACPRTLCSIPLDPCQQ